MDNQQFPPYHSQQFAQNFDMQYNPAPNQSPAPQALATSGLAIAALILGILGVITSPIPIVNNVAVVPAFLGFVFGIIVFVGILKGKKKGKGLAISGIVLSVVACILVLATQRMYSTAIDKALDGASVTSTTTNTTTVSEGTAPSSAQSTSASTTSNSGQSNELAVGASATLDNGLTVTVNSVTPGVQDYGDKILTGVTVTYSNGGSKSESFNTYDWKGQDAQGAQRSATIAIKQTNTLSSGTLAPGGSVSGTIYFDGDITKVLYFNNVFGDNPTAIWVL